MRSVSVLKEYMSGPVRYSPSLVILQFSVAILLIICTCMVSANMVYKIRLGVRLNQIMVSYSPMTMIKSVTGDQIKKP
jgi:hypothetical protein